jgi:hypothetical protein
MKPAAIVALVLGSILMLLIIVGCVGTYAAMVAHPG